MAKVSIIIPIYNVANYLTKAVNSAKNQTEQDIEIILVDDGSVDGSGALCDEFAGMDSRIRVTHKANGGLASARNAGVQASHGEYVLFLDGDDYLREDAVGVLIQVMRDYPSDFVQFRYREIEEGEEAEEREPDRSLYQANTPQALFENLYRLGGVAASGATKLMRRELALEIPFVNVLHEDEMWCTQAFQKKLTVTYISDELYYYVMRNGSIIHSDFCRKKLDLFEVSEKRIEVLKNENLDNLLHFEYERIFLAVLNLYAEAKSSNDMIACQTIKGIYTKHKSEISKNHHFRGRMKILCSLMSKSTAFLDLYAKLR